MTYIGIQIFIYVYVYIALYIQGTLPSALNIWVLKILFPMLLYRKKI